MPVATGFMGEHDLKIDAKGRITMPSRFRAVLNEEYPDDDGQVVIRMSLDRNLTVEPLSVYNRFKAKFDQYDSLNKSVRELRRRLFGSATLEKIDAGSRIRLSQKLRDKAGLDKEVTLVGDGHSFEVWDRSRYEDSDNIGDSDFEELIERVRLTEKANNRD